MATIHIPVMQKEVMAGLNLHSGDMAIDATLGAGGYTAELLKLVGSSGKVLAIEQDKEMIEQLSPPSNLVVAHGNFRNIASLARAHKFANVTAVVFDLGLSSWHLEQSGRGFSFQKLNEPLDMRFSPESTDFTAAQLVNSSSLEELSRMLKEYGEVRGVGAIAKKIVAARKKKRIISVGDLRAVLGISRPRALAQIFQSLRIAVNDELNALEEGIRGGCALLKAGGTLALISYHSLEDRIAKKILHTKPLFPSREEIKNNPRARSAQLRIFKKL